VALLAAFVAAPAAAEPVKVEAVLAPTQQIKADFKDGSKQFVLMVRREGKSTGQGMLASATVVEYGWHDIQPPHGGHPHGYLEVTAANGDVAYLKWTVRAVFVKGDDKPKLIDYGFWELSSGNGKFANMRGVGTLEIKAASPTERLFVLEGEIAPKP
jgi:hypothetical protein